MGAAATGVTVVTTDGPGGRYGMTVSSFCSVCADPPKMLGCLRTQSPLCAAIERNGRFAINVLSVNQSGIADVFAGRPRCGSPYNFDEFSWNGDLLGCPQFEGATATFACVLEERYESGTHFIYVGRVVFVDRSGSAPLLYSAKNYGRYVPLDRG
jgi:flavin reductase